MEQTIIDLKSLADSSEVYLLSKPKIPLLPINSLPIFNQKLWGLGRGRVVIVAGRTAMGKTALMTQISWDLAKSGLKTIYLSLEMPNKELYARCFSREFKIDNNELERGNFDKYLEKHKIFRNSLQKMNLKFSDVLGSTWNQVDEIIKRMEINKPDCIVIDHINHIKTSGTNDKAMIDDYLTNIQLMAQKHNITFIIGAQINRLVNNDKNPMPELHHLKGTGRLEEISDLVLLLFWEHYYNKNKPFEDYKIITAKNRYGSTGIHDCIFRPQYSLFVEKDKEYIKVVKDLTKSTVKEDDIKWEE